jgi:DNA-directed RNA polymerase specialized sigma24 family protein
MPLSPAESQINPDNRERLSARAEKGTSPPKWALTTEALDKLLAHFSDNREEAGAKYESMRSKLVRYFEWRMCPLPEDLADETINRVARRIDEGEDIFNLPGYFLTVARLVFMESLRDRNRTSVPLDEISEVSAEQPQEDEQKELRLRCLDDCLNELPIESRTLILTYYHDERRAKIERRKQLAVGLGIPLNALRIRAHRIRMLLEKCVRDCSAQPA